MATITLNAQTSIEALQAFAKSAGNNEIRAKTEKGVTTLYTHSSWKPSLNRDPIARAAKQRAGRDAIANFIQGKVADSGKLLTALTGANGGGALKGTGLAKVADKFEDHVKAFDFTMSHPTLRSAFKEFGAKEFATNNFNFMDRVDRFEAMLKTADPGNAEQMKAVREEAMSIVNVHIKESTGHFLDPDHTDTQVNLPGHIQKPLEKTDMTALNGMNKEALGQLFKPAKDDIEAMLRRDTFSRFKSSEMFNAAFEAL